MSTELSPFAAVEREFRRLANQADMRAPGEWIGCAEPLSLVALRDGLLSRSVDYEARDAALQDVAALARRDERWMVAMIGLLLPGLRRAVYPLAASCADIAGDVEAESLAALVKAVRELPTDAGKVAARLVKAATYPTIRYVAAEVAARAHCELTGDLADRSDDRSDLLATAVLEGVISKDDAVLIAETRVAGVSLAGYAREQAIGYDRAQKRRAAAESELREWLMERGTTQ